MNKTSDIYRQRKRIVEGLELTYQRLIEFKKSKKSPIVIYSEGKVIELSPEKASSRVK